MTVIVGPDDGTRLPGSFEVVVKVRSEDTGGALAVIEETVPPGAFITPHTHQNDVWVHVLSGEVGVLVGETIAVASAGAWALKPRGVVHAMWNATSEPARGLSKCSRRPDQNVGSKKRPRSNLAIATGSRRRHAATA